MCGLNLVLRGGTNAEMVSMTRAMEHRGTSTQIVPYGYGGASGTIWAGHRRLPIVGLSSDFDSPYEYNGWIFLFVGEIVNFREINPKATSDVQVLAEMWTKHGPECVLMFDGFWSFAAFKKNDPAIVHVMTDFLGKKPLYLRRDRLAISSEIYPLTLLGPTSLDPVYMSSVRKWGYHPGNLTWAAGVEKLPAGVYMILNRDAGVVHMTAGFDGVGPAPAVNLFEAMKRAVGRRLTSSDVPVALLISGGLDSSIIYGLAKGVRSDLTLYYAGNGDDDNYIDMLNPSETVIRIEPSASSIETTLIANEGPVDLGSVQAQYLLGQAIVESVALSGDGADELFGGYARAADYDSQYSDVFEELVHYHLPRLDKLMMRGTVELRCPFLSREVVSSALSVGWDQRNGTKAVLKKTFASIVPEPILNRTKYPLRCQEMIEDRMKYRTKLCNKWESMVNGL